MRKLVTADVFALSRVVKTLGVRDTIRRYLQQVQNGANPEDVSFDVILEIFEAAGTNNAEQAVYDMLAQIYEVKSEDVARMPINEQIQRLKQLAEENDLKSFFTLVLR